MRQILDTLRQVFALLTPRLRRRWAWLVPAAFFSAGMEMVATAGMLVLIRMISDPGVMPRSRTLALIQSRIPLSEGMPLIVPFALVLAAFYAVKNLLRLAETRVQQGCARDTSLWIASGLLERYLRAPYSLHLQRSSSELIHMLNGAADSVGWIVLQSTTALLSESMIVAGILTVLIWQVPGSAFLASALTGVVMVLLLWATQRQYLKWGRALHEGDIRLYQAVRQSLGSVKEAKILGRENYFVKKFGEVRRTVSQINTDRNTLAMAPRLVVETIFVATLAIVIVAAWLRQEKGGALVGTLGIFAFGGLRLLPSLHLIVYRFNEIGSGRAAVETLSRDWKNLGDGLHDDPVTPIHPLRDTICLESVSFRYDAAGSDREEPALDDVNLTIRRGESIGIVGATGAGKTTLVDLMLGLLRPTEGRVTVDGRDIDSEARAWQSQIGYVPQVTYLIDDTIRRNIALGVEDGEVDEGRVTSAAHAAQLEEFLNTLPQGLDTPVGERGVKLSGGERQRIAVARALYRRPAVLIFDEATAALDNATERALTETIQRLSGDTTMIFIAHRLTTVQWCDRLVFMRGGRIVDTGRFEELIERNAEFQRMAAVTGVIAKA